MLCCWLAEFDCSGGSYLIWRNHLKLTKLKKLWHTKFWEHSRLSWKRLHLRVNSYLQAFWNKEKLMVGLPTHPQLLTLIVNMYIPRLFSFFKFWSVATLEPPWKPEIFYLQHLALHSRSSDRHFFVARYQLSNTLVIEAASCLCFQPILYAGLQLIVPKCCSTKIVTYKERDENNREPSLGDKHCRSLFVAAAVCSRGQHSSSNYSMHSTFGGRLYCFRHVYVLRTDKCKCVMIDRHTRHIV